MKTGLCDSCLNMLKAPHSRFNDIHNWKEKGYEGIEYEAIESAKRRVRKHPEVVWCIVILMGLFVTLGII
eukprot:scaffold223082_cov23-Cyclotella_meneghiniana.AAC.1